MTVYSESSSSRPAPHLPTPSASMPLTFSHPPHFVDVKLPDLRDPAAMHKTCHTVLALLLRANHVFPLAFIQSAIFFDFSNPQTEVSEVALAFGALVVC